VIVNYYSHFTFTPIILIEYRGLVVNTPASFIRGPEFDHRTGRHQLCFRLMVLFAPYEKVLGKYLKIGRRHFRLHIFQLKIRNNSSLRRYITDAVGKPSLNNRKNNSD
jgi:hypothetical protein